MSKWFSNILPAIDNIVKTISDPVKVAEINPITKAAIDKVQTLPQIQQMQNSPLGVAAQGKFNQIIPAAKQELADVQSGKYKPQFVWGGEAGGGDFAKPGIGADISNASLGSSFKRSADINVKDDFVPNSNPEKPVYSQVQETPKSGFNKTELEQKRATFNSETQTTTENKPNFKSTSERTHNPVNATKENIITNQKRNINIDGEDIKTPAERDQVNATLNGYGITDDNLTTQLQKSNDEIGNLQTKAKDIIAKQGGTIKKSDLIDETKQGLGMNPSHNLDPVQADNIATNYIHKVYGRATNQPITSSFVVPDEIPGTVLQDMKTIMNSDAKSTFGQMDKTKWTPDQVASRNARDAADKILSTKYEDAKKLNNDMSDLYRAQDSLLKGANQEGAAAQKMVNAPPTLNPIQRFMKQPLSNKIIEATAATYGAKELLPLITGAAGYIGGKAQPLETKLADALGFTPKSSASNSSNMNNNSQANNNVSHTDSISSIVNSPSFDKIKPNSDGTYNLFQSAPEGQNQRHYMSNDEYMQGLQALTDKYPEGDANPYFTTAMKKLDTQYKLDKEQASRIITPQVQDFMTNATTYNNDGNQLGQTLATMPDATAFWNGVGKAGSIKAYQDPKYADVLQQIDSFNREFASSYKAITGEAPSDNMLLSSANSDKQALVKYNKMMQTISGLYGKYVDPYLVLNSGTGTQTNTGIVKAPTTNYLPTITAQPQAADFTNMVGGTNPGNPNQLPPIQ